MSETESSRDGTADFDFLHGKWDVANHYRRSPSAPWEDFTSMCINRPILGGLGNIESFHTDTDSVRAGWTAMTLRLYEPATDTWRIWWAANTHPGHLQPPMAGRFTNGHGTFFEEAPSTTGQRTRFRWSYDPLSGVAFWEQAVQPTPAGQPLDHWTVTWTMTLTNRISLGVRQ